MSLKTQARVLRALDEQSFLPVGATHPIHVDVRVIAATNKDLEEEIAQAATSAKTSSTASTSFRFLSRRCATARKTFPLLVKEFLQEFGQQYGRPHVEMHPDALDALRQYHWPGNVRELRNLIERVLILNPKSQRIERKHLPTLADVPAATFSVLYFSWSACAFKYT
jgi:two-component system nitrogen regulation response regulator NtrX